MNYKQKIICLSDYWYNDGLRKAQIRDMSGAAESLRRSLKYDCGNAAARNLLGLVYYGAGETAEALVQWIISKNIRPDDNIAEDYIKRVQDTPEELQAADEAVKRYNKSLEYCGQYSEDMAVLELKKAVAVHPSFLKAHQLLSLIYLHMGQYGKAKQSLLEAKRLDTANVLTLSYIYELTHTHVKKAAPEPKKSDISVEYNLGNETIIQPKNSVEKNAAAAGIGLKHLAAGVLLGAAAVWFLIVPAVNSGKAQKANKQLIEYSERFNAMEAQISAQTRALDEYRRDSADSENAAQNAALVTEDYENLMTAKEQWESNGYSEDVVCRTLILVRRDFLGEAGKRLYDALTGEIFPAAEEILYESGSESYEVANYTNAIDSFDKVIKMDEGYEGGKALLMLGMSYLKNEDKDNALIYLKRVVELFPDTENSAAAKSAIDEASQAQ